MDNTDSYPINIDILSTYYPQIEDNSLKAKKTMLEKTILDMV